MLYDLHILCSREKIFLVWWLSIRKLRVKNTLVTPQILSSMVRYKCIDFLLFIGMMMMMMKMMMMMMMKCGQKSSLNFFIFKKSHGAYKWSHYNCQIWYMVMPQIFFPKFNQNFETNSKEITTVSIFFWICFIARF